MIQMSRAGYGLLFLIGAGLPTLAQNPAVLSESFEGKQVPLAYLGQMAQDVLGGGASADDEPGGLFGDRLGLWGRGNYTSGDKSRSLADSGWDGDQWGLTAGADYRFTDRLVFPRRPRRSLDDWN